MKNVFFAGERICKHYGNAGDAADVRVRKGVGHKGCSGQRLGRRGGAASVDILVNEGDRGLQLWTSKGASDGRIMSELAEFL